MTTTGSCLCGAVSFTVDAPLRQVVACHCRQCRKTSGHHAAATAAPKTALSIEGADHISWFSASSTALRGFSRSCGSHLFWDGHDTDMISIFAGSLDGDTRLDMACHIYCGDKGDYYEIADSCPKYAAAIGGARYP